MVVVSANLDEDRMLQLVDAQTITEHLEQPPPGAWLADHGLQRVADFARVAIHEQLVSDKCKVPMLTMHGHPLAVRQAKVMWEKLRASHAVDCLPVRAAHSPDGEEHLQLLNVMTCMQEKYPQVAVEMQPMMSKSGLVHQLWLSCGDDELLLACRGELVVCLSKLFPGEYKQVAVKDVELWVVEEIDKLQSETGAAALLDRQRQALLVSGSAKQVEHASDFVEQLERYSLRVNAPQPDEEAHFLDSLENPDNAGNLQPLTVHEPCPAGYAVNDYLNLNESDSRCPGPGADRGQCKSPSMEFRATSSFNGSPDANAVAVAGSYHWYYVDDDERIQGPFDTDEMREWWELELLPEDLGVCCVSAAELPPTDKAVFYPLDQLFRVIYELECPRPSTKPDVALADEVITRHMDSEFDELGA